MLTVLLNGASDSEDLDITVQSLAEATRDWVGLVRVKRIGDQLDLGEATAALIPSNNIESSAEAASYIAIVPSGTTFRIGAFDRILSGELDSELAVFVAPQRRYALRQSLVDTESVGINDLDRIWAGSTPFVLRAEIFLEAIARAPSAERDHHLLFSVALSITGAFSILDGVQKRGLLEKELERSQLPFDPHWYFDFLEIWASFLESLAAESHSSLPYIQRVFLYLLLVRLRLNRGIDDKMALRGSKVDEFFARAGRALSTVDDDVIMWPNPQLRVVGAGIRLKLLRAKYGDSVDVTYVEHDSDVSAMFNEAEVESATGIGIAIDVMDTSGDVLELKGRVLRLAEYPGHQIRVTYGDHSQVLTDTGRYADDRVFGQQMHRYLTYSIQIPLVELKDAERIEFSLWAPGGVDVPLRLTYPMPQSKLSSAPKSYWVVSWTAILRPGDRFIGVQSYSRRAVFKAEAGRIVSMLKSQDQIARSAAKLRVAYFLSRPWYRKRSIWMYADRLFKGGDNGEYAFRFARRQEDDGIEKHYVASSGTALAARLEAEGLAYVPHNSRRQRLLFLNSEVVFATRVRSSRTFGFENNDEYFRDLFKYRVVYINHGLVVDRLDYALNQAIENIHKICVVSPLERNNLLQRTYGFKNSDVVETGFARFDGLEPKPARRILLTPTWRSYLHKPQRGRTATTGHSAFKESEYYRLFNSLITNSKLIAALERFDFELAYYLHPNTSPQAQDFEVLSHRVKVIPSTEHIGYEEIMSASSLMVTDYSGVQFDFATMMKPVVYFHPRTLPPHYEAAVFNYERDGFGEVVDQESELVDLLIRYMADDCSLSPMYAERIKLFFAHLDHQNSARVYEVGFNVHQRLLESRSRRNTN